MEYNAALGLFLLNKARKERENEMLRKKREQCSFCKNKAEYINWEENNVCESCYQNDSKNYEAQPCTCDCRWHSMNYANHEATQLLNYTLFKFIDATTDAIYDSFSKDIQKKINKNYEEYEVGVLRAEALMDIKFQLEHSLITCDESDWGKEAKQEYWKVISEINDDEVFKVDDTEEE